MRPGGTRLINAVGGHGGGAPPLPPIQNKKSRQQPERQSPDCQSANPHEAPHA